MATAPSAVSSESEIILRDDNVTPLSEELTKLYSQGFLTDITLSTEDGKNFEAHRILLAARSHYFHSVVPRLKSEPVIFLKGVKGTILDKILKYIYGGSVVVSKHQVRPLLEVAKSLQVKGLQDLVPGQLNQKAPQQHRFGRLSLPSTVDKTTLTTFKPPTTIPRRSAPSGTSNPRINPSVLQNGSTNSDTEDKDPSKDESDNEGEAVPKPKRRRGRPPKNAKVEEPLPSSSKDNNNKRKDASDPYDFEEEDISGDRKDKSWRSSGKKKKKGGENEDTQEDESKEEDQEEDSSKKELSNKGLSKTAGSSINGKQIIPVKCKGQLAELHISRFASGVKGLSIRYKDQWMTPQNFETACGCTTKYYLENIQTDYGPLKTLTASGMLKPHSRKCRCSLCRGEDPPSPSPQESKDEEEEESNSQSMKQKNNNHQNDSDEEDEDDDDEEDDDEDDDDDEEDEEEEEDDEEDEEEKRRMKKREEWSRQLEAKLKSEYDDSPPQITPQVTTAIHHQQQTQNHQHQQPQQQPQPPQILSTSPLVISNSATIVSGAPPSTSYISILDQPPKISPSILPGGTNTGGITIQQQPTQPERIDTPQTVYVMSSPHHHISAPPTPQHNPFANLTHSMATQISHQQPTVTMAINALPQQQQPQQIHQHAHQQQQLQMQQRPAQSRIGSVMQVRCKSTTALLYANKYESGSRGKCIQLGDEWLTPNEFEDRAGSKAKKYLSSIKCLGRPLRVYVNSGELRGSGNAHHAKLLKDKLKTPQPIAPAPPAGLMAHLNGIQAPPTPSHVSGSLPPNLNMMMATGGQPPILINQTSMASSIMGSPSIITGPMTVALSSPPFDIRPSQAM
uniref:Deformed epidermal autoregulatory factor 1 homolog [Acyrthosiphon pisum] n=1 Tax=Lepeophtheirus salmonis TaxID=72036 RepID=A0A0K2UHN6_LEPSM